MRRVGAALAVLPVLAVLASCGQGGSGGGLTDALAEVSGEGPAAAYFEYGEPAWWRGRGVTTGSGASGDARRWLPASVAGLGDLGNYAVALPEATGLTPTAGERAIAIGVPPQRASRIDGGVDADAVRAKLTAFGARPRRFGEHDGLSFAPGPEINVQRTIVPGLTNQLNQVVLADATVATAATPDALTAVMGGGRSLADSPDHAAVAECLGDVAAATITAPDRSGAVTLYGLGLRRPADLKDSAVNVICVLPVASAASTVEKTLTTAFGPEGRMRDGRRFGEHVQKVAHDRVTSGDRTVLRATLTLSGATNAMFANQLLQRGELQVLADPAQPGDPLAVLTPSPS